MIFFSLIFKQSFKKKRFLKMGMNVLLAYMPRYHWEGQKAASDPLKLELQMTVSSHVGAETRTWVL